MDISDMLDSTLQDIMDLEDGYLFSYEMEAYGTGEYEFDYLIPGCRPGDPEGYGSAHADIPAYIRIGLLCKGTLFAYGDLEFIPDSCDSDMLLDDPEGSAVEYAERWMEDMYGSGDIPDGAIVSMACDVLSMSAFYPEDFLSNTTPRYLIADSTMFHLA